MGTFLDLKDNVRSALGNRADIEVMLATVINQAQREVARAHDWEELFIGPTTVTLTNTGAITDGQFSLAADCSKIHSAWVDVGGVNYPLEGVGLARWSREYRPGQYTNVRSIPSHIVERSRAAEVWPLPNGTMDVAYIYKKVPATLVADTDVPDLVDKDDLVESLAASRIYGFLANEERATYWYKVYGAQLAAAKVDHFKTYRAIEGKEVEPVTHGSNFVIPFPRG